MLHLRVGLRLLARHGDHHGDTYSATIDQVAKGLGHEVDAFREFCARVGNHLITVDSDRIVIKVRGRSTATGEGVETLEVEHTSCSGRGCSDCYRGVTHHKV